MDERVTCFLPSLNTTAEALHVLESHAHALRCLTGSSSLSRSASVKYDLLILWKRSELRLELIE